MWFALSEVHQGAVFKFIVLNVPLPEWDTVLYFVPDKVSPKTPEQANEQVLVPSLLCLTSTVFVNSVFFVLAPIPTVAVPEYEVPFIVNVIFLDAVELIVYPLPELRINTEAVTLEELFAVDWLLTFQSIPNNIHQLNHHEIFSL